MADTTVLGHRLMVVHEGAAFLHVAGVASLVGAGLDQLFRVVAVDVMTRGTGHLAFDDRMVRWLVDLRTLLLVAGEADLGLG